MFFSDFSNYNQLEHSYIIFNTTADDMKWYGKLFQQQSFIFGIFTEENGKPIIDFSYYGRISPDEEYEKEDEVKGFVKIPDEQTDYFTIIGKKFRFSIPFPTFMNECYYYDRMVNYRKEHSEKYKNTYQNLLDMALNENSTGKSRKIARAHLYGTWWAPLDKRNQIIDEEREFYLMDDFQNI